MRVRRTTSLMGAVACVGRTSASTHTPMNARSSGCWTRAKSAAKTGSGAARTSATATQRRAGVDVVSGAEAAGVPLDPFAARFGDAGSSEAEGLRVRGGMAARRRRTRVRDARAHQVGARSGGRAALPRSTHPQELRARASSCCCASSCARLAARRSWSLTTPACRLCATPGAARVSGVAHVAWRSVYARC